MAVENGVKAFISCFEPADKVHEVSRQLEEFLDDQEIPDMVKDAIKELVPIAKRHGRIEHIRATDGDDETFTPPSEIYKEEDARRTLADAKKVVRAAQRVIKQRSNPK